MNLDSAILLNNNNFALPLPRPTPTILAAVKRRSVTAPAITAPRPLGGMLPLPACGEGVRERPASEAKLLARVGNSYYLIYREMVRWSCLCWLGHSVANLVVGRKVEKDKKNEG